MTGLILGFASNLAVAVDARFLTGLILGFASNLADRLVRSECKQRERGGQAMGAMPADASSLNRTHSRADLCMQERFQLS